MIIRIRKVQACFHNVEKQYSILRKIYNIYTVLQNVNIDVDNVQFNEMYPSITSQNNSYLIGEVELCIDSPTIQSRQHSEDVMIKVLIALGINSTAVRGKVLEYLYRFKPNHFAALLESGHLKSKGL